MAPNHLSFLDSVIVQALMPRPVAFFAKAEYFTTGGVKGKVMKSFFESVGSIPVERGEQAASVQALKPCWTSWRPARASASTPKAPGPGTASSTAAAPASAGLP